jgi:hypothetical protein
MRSLLRFTPTHTVQGRHVSRLVRLERGGGTLDPSIDRNGSDAALLTTFCAAHPPIGALVASIGRPSHARTLDEIVG